MNRCESNGSISGSSSHAKQSKLAEEISLCSSLIPRAKGVNLKNEYLFKETLPIIKSMSDDSLTLTVKYMVWHTLLIDLKLIPMSITVLLL